MTARKPRIITPITPAPKLAPEPAVFDQPPAPDPFAPLSEEDKAYWGAEDSDATPPPMPETRHIGQHLFFRADGVAYRLPLRLKSEYMANLDSLGDNVAAVLAIASDYADPTATAAFRRLDGLEQIYVSGQYFKAFGALAKATMGESGR